PSIGTEVLSAKVKETEAGRNLTDLIVSQRQEHVGVKRTVEIVKNNPLQMDKEEDRCKCGLFRLQVS
ncbi:MAG: hypothetical protein ACPKOP_06305, partial [Sphaerochaetaceae bacterium]